MRSSATSPRTAAAAGPARPRMRCLRRKEKDMKRFHVHVAVHDVKQSVRFYSALFGAPPSVEKPDYAKWVLEELGSRLAQADVAVTPQTGAACCYAKSDKYWTIDPQGVAWESFHTLGSVPVYGTDSRQELTKIHEPKASCC